MRLLLSAHAAGLYGAERVTLALASGLAARGHYVTLEIPHQGPLVSMARAVSRLDVWVSGRPRLPRNGRELLRFGVGAAPARCLLEERLRQESFHAVWVSSIYNAVAAWAGSRAGLPVLWQLHERNFRGPAGIAMAHAVSAWSHTPVAVSRYVAGTFAAYRRLRGRLRVLHNPLLESVIAAASAPRPFTVGYVGQLEPRKRVPDLIAALALLPEARALLVGDGKARGQILAAVARARVGDRVEVAGFQPDPASWYQRMDCVVIPSVREPFGLVALEGMAAGCPVVAAASGALPEVLGGAALLYPPGDQDALAAALRRLAKDAGLRQTLAGRGRVRVSSFGSGPWLDAAEALIREAAASPARRMTA